MNDNSRKPKTDMDSARDALARDLADLKQMSDAVMAGEWEGHKPRGLSESEIISITALVSYVAHTRGKKEDDVRNGLFERFGVGEIESLAPAAYDDAVRFLVDQVPEDATGSG
ncbi:MAG: hypothetical protein GC131_07830 [Alphaproteobacteria bacterium]|nr:hypothetical protein [Alphaproteobacteria bacterium]